MLRFHVHELADFFDLAGSALGANSYQRDVDRSTLCKKRPKIKVELIVLIGSPHGEINLDSIEVQPGCPGSAGASTRCVTGGRIRPVIPIE